MSVVYIEKQETFSYPNEQYKFAPSEKYPEYKWNDIAKEKNTIYDMVRNVLAGYGFDRENFGTDKWNPLRELITPGDTVLVKPNWVMHYNENSKGGTDCLFTNTAITRAVVDYVYLALEGVGSIYVADSAMPDCKFKQFIKVAHLDVLMESCSTRGIKIEIKDLRGDIVKTFSKEKIITENAKGIEIDLGKDSYFADIDNSYKGFRYSFLDARKMNEYYHTETNHRYIISDIALKADVILNLPKIKTHRKAGYTAALKNYIGICYKKDAIPHFVKGNVEQGGDEFNGPEIIFQTESNIRDIENKYEANQNRTVGLFFKMLRIPFWMFRRLFAKRYQGIGNWHGNDTIWRAILDINRIIYYANKQGILQGKIQRRFFTIGDMIIAGEKNGPLAPSPKKCGCLICSENPIAFDKVVLKLMGFIESNVPLFRGMKKDFRYTLPIETESDICVFSNDDMYNNVPLNEIKKIEDYPFRPADGWETLI